MQKSGMLYYGVLCAKENPDQNVSRNGKENAKNAEISTEAQTMMVCISPRPVPPRKTYRACRLHYTDSKPARSLEQFELELIAQLFVTSNVHPVFILRCQPAPIIP